MDEYPKYPVNFVQAYNRKLVVGVGLK